MRLFAALDIDDAIRARIAGFLDGVRGFVPDARWLRPDSLHVTLKFIGEESEDRVENIKRAMETIKATRFEMSVRGYGFFPGPRMARVFWLGVGAGPELPSLAASVDEKLGAIGVPKEEHVFNPHLTLARRAGGSSAPRRGKNDSRNRSFQKLQEKLSALPTPVFGTMPASEFFLYRSELSPGGSKYTKLAGFPLR